MAKINLSSWGPATVLVVGIALIVVAAGAVVCIVNPDALSFSEYTERLAWLGASAGGLAIGRGVLEGKKAEAAADIHRDPVETAPVHEEHDLHEHGIS